MPRRPLALCLLTAGLLLPLAPIAPAAVHAAAPPKLPDTVQGKDGVKAYLLAVAESCQDAAADLKSAADDYAQLVKEHKGDPAAAAKAQPEQAAELIHRLRDAYEQLDSYGYEYIEGIVAGVPSLVHYDVELDSGLPLDQAADGDPVAPVVIRSGSVNLDHAGSLNNFLIEPTVFGSNPKFTQGSARLPGFDKPVNLPKPELIVALADYAVDGYDRLSRDARAWDPTDADCFQAIYNMTPTLAGYFDEWKQTKEAEASGDQSNGGRFVAVSRVSDMRGIMSSVQLTWQGVKDGVQAKDPALAQSITAGYDRILTFIDRIDARNQAQALPVQAIDALGSQARQRADKVTVQIAQSAAMLNIDVE